MGSNSNFGNKTFKDLFPYVDSSSPVTAQFLNEVANKGLKYITENNNRDTKVVNFKTPEELEKLIDFKVKEDPESLETILNEVDNILKYVVRTGHPRYFNTLWSGADITAVAGEWLTTSTNTSMFTFETAPVYIMMEKFMWNLMCNLVGFKNGDGIFFPGGSLCNIAAINLARFRFNPSIKEEGIFGQKRLIIYASEESHYSIMKGAALCGFGTKSVVKLKTDPSGKIIPEDLEKQIKESIEKGDQPMIVVATAGTTVGGAYDPINKLADITEKHNIWLHVDGAWGAPCMLSSKHKHFMSGIERADSLTWDPHKMMGLLQQCAFLLVKEKGLLHRCNSANASYLFQQDKTSYDVSYDTGDKTFVCGRRNDVFKLWLYFKSKGMKGVEEDINQCFANSRHLAAKVIERDGFELLREPECANTCFIYIPPRIAAMPKGEERDRELKKVAPMIKHRMTDRGTMLIAYQPLKEHLNFFRMINANPGQTFEDMEFIVDEIERLGKDL